MKQKFFTSVLVAIAMFIFASFIIGTEQWERAVKDIDNRSVITDNEIVQINKKHGFNCDANEGPSLLEFIKVGAQNIIRI